MPITNDVTRKKKKENFNFHLQNQKKLKKKYHFPIFLSPENKCHIMQAYFTGSQKKCN